MPISVQCTACGKNLRVPDAMAGKRGKCSCGNVISIPANGAIQPAKRPSGIGKAGGARPLPPPGKTSGIAKGGGGAAPGARIFKKLFMIFWLCFGIEVLLGIVMGVVMTMAASSAAGSVKDAAKQMEEEQKKLQEEMKKPDFDPVKYQASQKKIEPDVGGAAAGGIVGTGVGCTMAVVGLVQILCIYMFLYKAWALIQDGSPRTTPMMAVLLMFIPLFNLYWQFVAWRGLCEDLNKYAEERGMNARQTSVGLNTAGLALNLVGCAPIGLVLLLISWMQIKNACVDIATAKGGA